MKKHCSVLALLFACCLPGFAQIGGGDDCAEHLECGKALHSAMLHATETSRVPDNYDVSYHRLEWDIDPAVNYIKGKITTRFTPKATGFAQISFDLSKSLVVDSVRYHGKSLSFEQLLNDVLRITLPGAVPVGQTDSIAVFYQGTPPSTGFGSWNQTTHNGAPIIWTLSEPYSARDWWPCKQTLLDKPDSVDVLVTTPAAYRAASNGLLLSEAQNGNLKTYHWKTRYPIATYLIAIAVTNYAVYSDFVPQPGGGSPLEVLNYAYPESLNEAKAGTASIVPIIQLFDSLTIRYPFSNEKYGHAQFGWGGGMEHQTMTFIVSYDYGLLAHECAHQWFGDYITCGSWQDIWLNEGFATYFEGLTRERYFAPATWYAWKAGKIQGIVSQPGGSVSVSDTTSVGRIFSSRLSYSKGAYLLHMLRWKLGSNTFFNGLKSYLADPKLAYGYAYTADLQHHLETVSGQSLQTFFDQWFYGEGYPTYQVNVSQNVGNQVGSIFQTTSHPSVSFFEMPVPIRFSGQGQDTVLVFDHTFSGQQFTINLPFKIESVTVDPDLWLISANNNTVVSTYDLLDPAIALDVFPNPVADQLMWSIPAGWSIEAVSIINTSGAIVQSVQGNIHTLATTALPSGLYTFQVQTDRGIVVKKFVKN